MEQTTNFNLKKPAPEDFYNVQDFNDNMDIIDARVKAAQEKADQAFQSASSGKEAIKAAITGIDPTVTIPTDATFQQLTEAIGQIETGVDTEDATATAEYILSGLTAYVKGVKVTGTGVNNGPSSATTVNLIDNNQEYTIAKGFHSGLRKIKAVITNLIAGNIKAGASVGGIVGTFTADATAGASATLNGYKGYQNGVQYTGNIPIANPDISGQLPASSVIVGASSGDGLNYLYMQHGLSGKYSNDVNWVRSYQPDLIAANILSGKNICGMVGTAIAGKRYANGEVVQGSVTSFYSPDTGGPWTGRKVMLSDLNLSFTPSVVILLYVNSGAGIYATTYFRQGFYTSGYGVYTCKSDVMQNLTPYPLRPVSGDINEIITTNFQNPQKYYFWAWE